MSSHDRFRSISTSSLFRFVRDAVPRLFSPLRYLAPFFFLRLAVRESFSIQVYAHVHPETRRKAVTSNKEEARRRLTAMVLGQCFVACAERSAISFFRAISCSMASLSRWRRSKFSLMRFRSVLVMIHMRLKSAASGNRRCWVIPSRSMDGCVAIQITYAKVKIYELRRSVRPETLRLCFCACSNVLPVGFEVGSGKVLITILVQGRQSQWAGGKCIKTLTPPFDSFDSVGFLATLSCWRRRRFDWIWFPTGRLLFWHSHSSTIREGTWIFLVKMLPG